MMVSEQQNAPLTILFADISGSTAFYDKLGNERALQLITRTLDILIVEMAKHRGTLIKTIGDEIMCTFPDATDAVVAAQAMHFALDQNPASGQPIYVRIGIHFGDVICEAGDVFGDAVNVAARVAGITRARQILTTQTVVDRLPAELRNKARQVMRAELRGKESALNLYQIIWEKDDTMSTRIGMSTFRKPAETQRRNELLLRYRQQLLTLNEQQRSVLLGRDESSCDVVILNKLASRQHGRIEYSYGKFLFTDHSANGTYIRFSDNQVVQLHHQQIVLHGSGSISLGQSFAEAPADVIEYILQ